MCLFHGWFGVSFAAFLHEVLDHALEQFICSNDSLDSRFIRFRDVLVPDTVVTPYLSLTDSFPGSGYDLDRGSVRSTPM